MKAKQRSTGRNAALIATGALTLSTGAIAQDDNVTGDAQSDEDVIEEIIVTGYGTQVRTTMTGSVSSIDTEEMSKFVTYDPALALQGRAPGIQVLSEGAIPGAGTKVIIRGTATFGNTDPLFVIDGAFSANGMAGLNSADIESIDILKDAAAAAIYGSRAANGVVVITTKKGHDGPPEVQISTSIGYQTPSNTLDYLNADQWRTFSQQISANDGNPLVPEDSNPNFSQGVDNNWEDIWLDDDSPIYSTDVRVSGGSEHTNYLISFGHLYQEGIVDFAKFEKFTGRINLGLERGRFNLTESLGISYSENNPNSFYGGAGGLARHLVAIPTAPVTDDEGNYVVAGEDFYQESFNIGNPYALAAIDDNTIDNLDIVGSLALTVDIIDGLKYMLRFSGNYTDEQGLDLNDTYSFPILGGSSPSFQDLTPSIGEGNLERWDYTIDNLIFYDKSFGDHNFATVVGYSEFNEDYRETGTGINFENVFEEQLRTVNGSATSSGLELNAQLRSSFARINYDYAGRYLFGVTVRHDESSKFSSGNNSDTFPSYSAGWNAHEESWFPLNGVVSHLKVTASHGELGANFIDPYQFNSVAFGPLPAIFGDNQSLPGDRSFGRVTQLLDPNLAWETSTSDNLGVELGLWDDALSITAEYYERENKDILAPVPLPPSAGQTIIINDARAPDVNAATIKNKGFELTLEYGGEWGELEYDIGFNLGTIDNEVESLGENVIPIVGQLMSGSFDDRPTRTDAGRPIGSYYGYLIDGLDANGNFQFTDTNGRDASGSLTGQPDGNVNDDDKVYLGDPFPDYNYGINWSGAYRNWDFSVFLEGSEGADIYSQIKYSNYFLYDTNVVTDAANGWTPSNTNTGVPRATLDNRVGGNALPSEFYVEDGSYLRIRDVQVGYTFEDGRVNRLGLERLRLYFSAQNLHTWTDYSGYDPAVSSDSLFNRGVDYRGFPNAETYMIGLDASF